MDYKPVTPHKYAAKYTTAEVLLISNAGVIVVLGLCLISLTIWSFIKKIVMYSYFMEVKLDPTFFAIPAGVLSLCSVAFAVLLRSNNNLKYMLWFLALQITSVALVFTGAGLGTHYQLSFSNETVPLGATIPTDALNVTLMELLAIYEVEEPSNDTALDRIQTKFGCCGVENVSDFIKIPWSCCIKNDCDTFGSYPTGCLRSIREDVAWQKHITSSLCQLLLLLSFFNAAIVASIYISNRSKRKSIPKPVNQSENI